MRKGKFFALFALGTVAVFVAVAYAVVWHTANQFTVSWNAVTTVGGGRPLPEGQSIQYDVYLRNAMTGGDPVKITEAPILETQYTPTLNVEGQYYVGIEAIRYNEAGEEVSRSDISWSDDPTRTQSGEQIGWRYYDAPDAVGGIR